VSPAAGRAPGWLVASTWILSLFGLGISAYLTFTHFAGTAYLACSARGIVDCAQVTTSAQSYFLHMPVAVLGLADFAVLSVLNSPWLWRSPRYAVHLARLVVIAGSMAFVLWLVAAELLIINHICLWCTGVHVITFALLILVSRLSPAQLGSRGSVAQ
jgi:uncharacterized membrane protein